MRVSERCRRVLLVTVPGETLPTAARRMRRYDVSALPLYRGRRLTGIVTERDRDLLISTAPALTSTAPGGTRPRSRRP